MQKFRSPQHSAFTLIELLVVIAIIVLLAAILFPVFGRARENARRSSCQSNVKQIALGIKQYTQDYDERFPNIPSGAVPDDSPGWAYAIQPYLKSEQIFQCPSDTLAPPTQPTLLERAVTNGFSDYYINGNLVVPPSGPGGISESAIDFAANTIMNGEAVAAPANAWAVKPSGSGGIGGKAPARHLEGANYSFVDGHVKWLRDEVIKPGDTGCTNGANSPTGSNATFCIN